MKNVWKRDVRPQNCVNLFFSITLFQRVVYFNNSHNFIEDSKAEIKTVSELVKARVKVHFLRKTRFCMKS